MYAVLLTINFSTIINTGFILYLWTKLYYDTPLLKYEIPEAYPSAPELK
jgi:hypothetical protein